MNDNWGYCAFDSNWKPAPMLIRKLVECVSKGGNLLLNVGPDAWGNIPEESLGRLAEIGKWMRWNSESVKGCGPAPVPKPDFGRATAKGDRLFFHVFDPPMGALAIQGVDRGKVLRARSVATGAELPVVTHFTYADYPDVVFVDLGPDPNIPDTTDYVVELEMRG